MEAAITSVWTQEDHFGVSVTWTMNYCQMDTPAGYQVSIFDQNTSFKWLRFGSLCFEAKLCLKAPNQIIFGTVKTLSNE